MSEKLTPEEFSNILKEKWKKTKERNKDKGVFIVGCFVLPKNWTVKMILVECFRCGVPIYVSDWVYEEGIKHFIPGTVKHPFFCPLCIPQDMYKGIMTQDLVTVINYLENKKK